MVALAIAPFWLGAVIGSFLNVVAHRLPRGASLARPRSHCPGCLTPIKPYDNVPILSWLWLKGRCRACSEPISPRYPLVELGTGLLFAGLALAIGPDPELLLALFFCAVLVAVSVIDLDHRIIPNRILALAAAVALVGWAAIDPARLPEMLAWGAGGGGFLLLAHLARPGGMGMGDVKLAGVMGLYLGSSVVPALLIAFAAGAILGVSLMLRQGAGARKQAVPFGPFLALGAVVGLLAGPEIVDWYLGTFVS
jgi:leader peptidase (prepilin peptidase) / N-methyltransferase